MSKFICYGMKREKSIDTLERVTEEELIKGKLDVYNYKLLRNSRGAMKWQMVKKPFEALKDNYSQAVGKGYMWGEFTVLGKKDKYILIYGYELNSVENAKKILSKAIFKNTNNENDKKFNNFIKELNSQKITNDIVEQGKNYLIIEVEGDWKHDLLASEEIARSCGLYFAGKEEVGDVDSDWGRTQYKYI